MCIKAIANFDYEAAKDNLVETLSTSTQARSSALQASFLRSTPRT